ncbi:MAG: tetratricopeptide repeat protein [Rickettsiales bacterium]|nr:tetratricopeptide repeat protein [Rickettsiales bacterium]
MIRLCHTSLPLSLLALSLVSACDAVPMQTAAQSTPSPLAAAAPTDERPRVSLQAAEELERSGNLIDAVTAYQEIAKYPETAVTGLIKLSVIYRKLGRYPDALTAMKEAQALQPANPKVLLHLGYALIDADQSEEAIRVLDGLTAMEPGNISAYNAKAVAFDNAGNHIAAQELYQKVLSLNPASISAHNNLAMSYILNNQIDDAITLLEVINKGPDSSATVRQNLALAYGIKGQKARALALNLKDVSREKAEENLRFYEQYARNLKEKRPEAPPTMFDAMAPDTTPVDTKADAPIESEIMPKMKRR